MTMLQPNMPAVVPQPNTKPFPEWLTSDWLFVETESELTASLLDPKKRVMLKKDITTTIPITLLDGTLLDLNGFSVHGNHAGQTFASFNECTIMNGTVYSDYGIDMDYVSGNNGVNCTNSRLFNLYFHGYGADAVILNGGCFVDDLRVDNVRDNPLSIPGNWNHVGELKVGQCAGDLLLVKGSNNTVSSVSCEIAGYRTDQTDYTAGSGVVMGADGTKAYDNFIGHVNIGTWGGLLFYLYGDRNTIQSIKASGSAYTDKYPKAGSQNDVYVGIIDGSKNKIHHVEVETSPRGIGFNGQDNFVGTFLASTIGKAWAISILSASLSGNKIDYVHIKESTTSANTIRIHGDNTRIGTIIIEKTSGGADYAAKITSGTGITINRLEIYGDGTTTSSRGAQLDSTGLIINVLIIKGFDGRLVYLSKQTIIRFMHLKNTASGWENILNVGDTSKFVFSGCIIEDLTGTKPPTLSAAGTVLFSGNISPSMTSSGGGTVTNLNNI